MQRRKILGLRWAGIIALSCLLIACLLGNVARGAQVKKIRLITEEAAPAVMEWTKNTIKAFEAEHPDTKVVPNYIGFDEFYPKLMSEIAAGTPPQIIKCEVNEAYELYFKGKYLVPLTDLIEEWGKEDFLSYARLVRNGEDYFFPTETSAHSLYYRKDWLAEAGLEPPLDWDEWIATAKALTKDTDGDGEIDRWGEIIPMARSRSAAGMFYDELWIAGGTIFAKKKPEELTPEDITIDSAEVRNVLKLMKELYKYSPPGSPGYSWGELRTTFYTGKVGMTHYAGRVFSNTAKYAPELLPVVGTTHMPTPTGKVGPTYSTTGGYVVMKGTKHPELAKEFIKFMHQRDRYIRFLHTVPGQFIPPMHSLMRSEDFLAHPLFKKYPDVIKTIIEVNYMAYPFSSEWPSEPNPYTSTVAGSLIITDMIQDYILRNIPIDKAIEKCEKRIVELIGY